MAIGSLAFVASVACDDEQGTGGAPSAALTREQLLDPASCQGCHPVHYRQWASSMHAYASFDPVFLAMNRRGQRETDGALGDFCVRCHAPLAVREGATTNGLDLDRVPKRLQGVTCYFCHDAVGVGAHENGDVRLGGGTTLRAGIVNPVLPGAHRAEYSRFHDRNSDSSTALCGSCHDVRTPAGVRLERTLQEYEDSSFAAQEGFDTCVGCHMDGHPGAAAVAPGAPETRTVHEHLFAGVDVALSDFPDREAQRKAVECALATSARVLGIDDDGFGKFAVRVETNAGHHQPSGAAQDRRLWLEFTAYAADDAVLFQSGALADDELEDKAKTAPGYDPQLMLFRDWIYDSDGNAAHQFWDAAPSAAFPDGRRSLTLPPAQVRGTAHSLSASYQVPPGAAVARVVVRLRMRPLGRDVVQDLVDSRDLATEVAAEVPTFTLHGAAVEWRPGAKTELRSLWPDALTCPDAYRCLLDPGAGECDGG